MKNQFHAQAGLLYKFTDIKTEEKGNRKITDIDKEIAKTHHKPAELTGISAENICKCIKKKHKACKQFYKYKRAAAILLKLMTRPQKDSYLETKERKKNKSRNADSSNKI